ncbi:MAG: hypothetical protein WC099_00110 [Candidatus Paceibacterota bacterium]
MNHFFNKEDLDLKTVFTQSLSTVLKWDNHRKNGTYIEEISKTNLVSFNFLKEFLKTALVGLSILEKFSLRNSFEGSLEGGEQEIKILNTDQQHAILDLYELVGKEREKELNYYREKIISLLTIVQIIHTQIRTKEIPDVSPLLGGLWFCVDEKGFIETISGPQLLEKNIEKLKHFLAKEEL